MNEITEKWARHAPAGAELDRVCAEWMGWTLKPLADNRPAPYSTDWSAAGSLLEAMGVGIVLGKKSDDQWGVSQAVGCGLLMADAPTPQLAIARACAVLVARGITCEDLGDA